MSDVYYDMYSVEINADPYPVYRRLREEAPIYYNDKHDFFAVSRFEDVEKGLLDAQTYISGKGAILEMIKADIDIPPGVIIFEDPPTHTIHRRLLSRAFTPRRVAELEPKIREFCAHSLDPLVGAGGFDFIADFGAPDADARHQHAPRDPRERPGSRARPRGRQPPHQRGRAHAGHKENFVTGAMFADYVDWRAEHPSDDIMTELLQRRVRRRDGNVRKLTRNELLTYLEVLAGAGNETTTRLIGWTAKVLAEHPDQRARSGQGPFADPRMPSRRSCASSPPRPTSDGASPVRTSSCADVKVPEGSVMLFLLGSANRDDRRFPDGDTFDIHREGGRHLTFGNGIHLCMGSALARMEGRIALEEVLARFPKWDIDMENARLSPTSTVRGWETLPGLGPLDSP